MARWLVPAMRECKAWLCVCDVRVYWHVSVVCAACSKVKSLAFFGVLQNKKKRDNGPERERERSTASCSAAAAAAGDWRGFMRSCCLRLGFTCVLFVWQLLRRPIMAKKKNPTMRKGQNRTTLVPIGSPRGATRGEQLNPTFTCRERTSLLMLGWDK